MEHFENLLNQINNPDFASNGKVKLFSLGKDLIKTNISFKNKKKIIKQLIYFYPSDSTLYYDMACLYDNKNIDKQIFWHKLAYNIKPDNYENLLSLCRILFNKELYREIVRLNVNNLFDKFIFNEQEFMHYYFFSLKLSMLNKDILKCALHRVKEGSQFKCINHEQMVLKYNNYYNLGSIYFSLSDISSSIKHIEKAHDLAVKFNLQENILTIYQTLIGLYDYTFYNHNDYLNRLKTLETLYEVDNILKFDLTSREKNKKIKIGYVSSDFNTHAVTHFIYPILQNYNREKFEVYIYINNRNIHQIYQTLDINKKIIFGLNDYKAAEIIYNDNIDILFDLNGNTTDNRVKLFSYKPSPIQITYIGHPNTTCSKYIDYKIVDNITNPSNSIQYYSEKLLKMEGCFLLYSNIFQVNLPNPKITNHNEIIFGSLNKESKNSDFILDLWSKILNQVPNSKIKIKIDSFDNNEERLQYYSKKLNVQNERIIILTKLHDQAYFNLFTEVDILLDTSPYSGTTTTCHALYNSLPVITLHNKDYHAHNVSSSLLINSGLNELVAYNDNEYIEKAVNLAKNHSILNKYKYEIREKFLNLMNPTNFMMKYEEMLETLK